MIIDDALTSNKFIALSLELENIRFLKIGEFGLMLMIHFFGYKDLDIYVFIAMIFLIRCYDANLVDIPVEIESPDHHYYHVWILFPQCFSMNILKICSNIFNVIVFPFFQIAFFTTRAVKALEELTWV